MSDWDKFETADSINERFLEDRRFIEEDVSQSVGRFDWICTRQQAHFLRMLFDSGLPKAFIAPLLVEIWSIQQDLRGFVTTGLTGEEDYYGNAQRHPQAHVISQLIEQVVEVRTGEYLADYVLAMYAPVEEMETTPDEDVIHHLEALMAIPPIDTDPPSFT